jgi:uncharacterized protein YbjT (DUF2867 family)
MKIAITTPTGNIGRRLTHRLLDEGGYELVLLARDPAKLAEEEAQGARIAAGSLADTDYVRGATEGVDALFFLCPPRMDVPDMRAYYGELARAGAAAVEANGIGHTLLLSSVGAHLTEGTGPILGLHDAEEVFEQVAPALTVLRPGYFMENYLWQVETIREHASVFMPVSGDVSMPMIATTDIAERAAEAIAGLLPSGKHVVSLQGPREYSMDECAGLIGMAIGKEVRHVEVPPAALRENLLATGASEGAADTMLEMYAGFQAGRVVPEKPRSEAATTATSFERFCENVLAPAIRG